ncbi:MAG: NAD(+) diphosphatase [Myxococcales bacterium]
MRRSSRCARSSTGCPTRAWRWRGGPRRCSSSTGPIDSAAPAPTRPRLADAGRARRCPRCEAVFYPRIAPAMMVLITRDGPSGRELLLARGTRFSIPLYSALAGFVEPSESLEECVHREVREEVGLRVRELRYFGSQCWPFPHSLMVAFLAEWDGGEIVCDPGEIGEARFFPVNALPPMLPHRLSVARKLLEAAVAEARGSGEGPALACGR